MALRIDAAIEVGTGCAKRIENGKRRFALVRWGLLPSWVKDPKSFALLINARGESVLDKPAFKNAMKRRRCYRTPPSTLSKPATRGVRPSSPARLEPAPS